MSTQTQTAKADQHVTIHEPSHISIYTTVTYHRYTVKGADDKEHAVKLARKYHDNLKAEGALSYEYK